MVKIWQVESFKYLGSQRRQLQQLAQEIKSRIAIAKRRMIELQDIWNDRNLSKDLMTAEMWIWRRMLGVSWKEKRTNASILSELDVKQELLGKVMTLKLAYFGHIMRSSGSSLTLQIVEGMVEGKRKRGRQKKQ